MRPEAKTKLLGCLSIVGGVLIHFSYGYFYTISNMIPYIMSYMIARVSPTINTQLSVWLSAVTLAMQGVAMPIGGILAKKLGFRPVVIFSCFLQTLGVVLTYFTIKKTFIGLVVTYSVFMGFGLGLGYSVVMAICSGWFPQIRGLITGLIVGGFGLGAFVFTPIQTVLINPTNTKVGDSGFFEDPALLDRIPNALLILGGILAVLHAIGNILLREKPKEKNADAANEDNDNNKEEEEEEDKRTNSDANSQSPTGEVNIAGLALLRHIDFYLLWFIMFCSIFPITLITAAYKSFGQELLKDDRYLSAVATASAIFNSGGRIIWGMIVDKTSFKIPLCTNFAVWAAFLLSFPYIGIVSGMLLKVVYAAWVCILFFLFSGIFVLLPGATGTVFGSSNLAVNYGMVFHAFTYGSIICAIITSLVKSKNAFLFQFTFGGCFCVVGFLLAMWVEDRKISHRCNAFGLCATRCPSLRVQKPDIDDDEDAEEMQGLRK